MTPQHMEALAKGNRIRLARAELKRDIREGRESVAGVIAVPPECVLSMAVGDLLMAQPRWGRSRAQRALRRAQVSEFATVERLTARQVLRLRELLA